MSSLSYIKDIVPRVFIVYASEAMAVWLCSVGKCHLSQSDFYEGETVDLYRDWNRPQVQWKLKHLNS